MEKVTKEMLAEQLAAFLLHQRPRRQSLGAYYNGEQEVDKGRIAQGRPNNKLHANFAKYITDVHTGYFLGMPATFDFETAPWEARIKRLIKSVGLDDLLFRIGRSMSIFGTAYAIVYKESLTPCACLVDPTTAFIIKSDRLGGQALGGVRLYHFGRHQVKGELYIPGGCQQFVYSDGQVTLSEVEPVATPGIALVEFQNNGGEIGDFEPVLSLIDAYNLLLSGAMDDMQSVANAFLAIYGMQGTSREDIEAANRSRVLSLAENGRAEFVVKNVNPQALEMLKTTIADNMLMVTMTPDLRDESFGSTQSGIAMQYKLWGIEQARSEKQRSFTTGLQKLLWLLADMSGISGEQVVAGATIRFYRNLPQDTNSLCENVANLGDIVSHKTKLELLPFVENAQAELERIEKEKGEDVNGRDE